MDLAPNSTKSMECLEGYSAKTGFVPTRGVKWKLHTFATHYTTYRFVLFSPMHPVARRPSSSCRALSSARTPGVPTPSPGSARSCPSSHRPGTTRCSRSPPCRSPSSSVVPLLRGGQHGGPPLRRNGRWRGHCGVGDPGDARRAGNACTRTWRRAARAG
jgi:hypothetical protein